VDTYTGPATLVLSDGREVDVRATLHTYTEQNLARWRGSPAIPDGASSVYNDMGSTCTLRLPDGATGEAVIFGVGGEPLAEVADVRGSGPVPL
jgi:hypothetical protein